MRYKKSLTKRLTAMILMLGLLITSPGLTLSFAETTPAGESLQKAIDWLGANQNGDGSWGLADTAFLDTSEVSGYLSAYGVLADNLQQAVLWMESQEVPNYDAEARMSAYIGNAEKSAAMKNDLLAGQNEDGGWGIASGYESDLLDTAIVLDSLVSDAGTNSGFLQNAASYLINRQHADGSWSLDKTNDFNVFITSRIALTLSNLQVKAKLASSEVDAALRRAGEYLVSVQNDDQTWGTDADSIVDTLLAYRAVMNTVGLDDVSVADSVVISLQNADGSWFDSPYITALAMKALKERLDMPTAEISAVRLYKNVDGVETECYSYNAYDDLEIDAAYTCSNADARLAYFIKQKDGSVSSLQDEFGPKWNTSNSLPGEYAVVVQVRDSLSGKILDSMETPFDIVPSFKLCNVNVSTNPGYTYVNNNLTAKADASVQNQSNIDGQVDVVTNVYLGDASVANSTKTVTCKASDQFIVVDTLTFEPDVTSEKEYVIRSEFFKGAELIGSGENTFRVLPVASDVVVFNLDMKPEDTGTQDLDVAIPSLPPKADVVFAFDLTGSMGGILNTAKSKAIEIMNQLNSLGVDINYGVISYMDYNGLYYSYGYYNYYGWGADYPYKMNRSVTNNIASVSSAINSLYLGNGEDTPEDYTRILYESYADSSIGWRDGSKKILVNFGDSYPHDNNVYEGVPGYEGYSYSSGGDPGRDAIMGTADDLDLQTVLSEMAENNVELIACQTYASYSYLWSYWAGITGGHTYNTNSSNMSREVINAVTEGLATPTVSNLRLVPSEGFAPWITGITPESYSGPTETVVPFTVDLKVPAGTPDGLYTFRLEAVDDSNVKYATFEFNINVETGAISPVTDITTDKPEYAKNEDAVVTVTARNITNNNENLTGRVDILDSAGNLVNNLAENISVTWGPFETKILNYTWNTGSTLAGEYTARITWARNGEDFMTDTAAFKIIPDKSVSSTVISDKQKYTADEAVTLTETVRNNSTNSIEIGLIAKTYITDSSGRLIWNTENTLPEMLSESRNTFRNVWNTGKSAPGLYTAKLEVYRGEEKVSESSAVFEIAAEAEGVMGVSGSLQVLGKNIYPADNVNLKYTVNNTGNVSLTGLTVRVRIVDTATETVLGSISDTIGLGVSESLDFEKAWVHTPLKTGTYMAVLDSVLADGREIPLGSGFVNVENPYETEIGKVVRPRVLVWAESESNIGLAEETLAEMNVFHTIVNNREAFMEELRTGQYNLYMLLDSKKPLTGHDDEELAAEVAKGKGIISSRDANGDNLKNLGIFGAKYTGSTTVSDYSVTFPASSAFGAQVLTGSGKAQHYVLDGGIQLAELSSKKGASPGVVRNTYGNGKALLFAFDLGSCSGPLKDTLKKAVELVAPAADTDTNLVELLVKVKADTAIGAELKLNIPEGAEIVWLSPEMDKWTFDTVKDQEYIFRAILRLPAEAGDYTVSVDSYYAAAEEMLKFNTSEITITR